MRGFRDFDRGLAATFVAPPFSRCAAINVAPFRLVVNSRGHYANAVALPLRQSRKSQHLRYKFVGGFPATSGEAADAPAGALKFRAMANERTVQLSASPPLFDSRLLDFFSRVHPSVPALIYFPVIAGLVWLASGNATGAGTIALLIGGGLGLWTLAEYWLHRKIFHWEPDNAFGRRMHFIIHGVHHEHPNDKLRLVMPPGASIPLAALFGLGFWAIGGVGIGFPLFAGFLVGYLTYDYTHYYLHHYVPRSERGKRLREAHMRHHFQDHRFGFGVSSPIWDAVFGTLPRRRS